MKNQNDLIALIVAIVVGLGGIATFAFFMKPEVPNVTAPAPVNTTEAALPQGAVSYTAALPGGGSNTGGGGGGFAGRGGAAGGFGGPAAGMARGGAPAGPSAGAPGAPPAGKNMPGANSMSR